MEDLELEKPGSEPTTPSPEQGAGATQRLCIAAVQLKIVGESLGILQDFGKQLELVSFVQQQTCRVTFKDGSKKVFEVHVRDVSQVYQAGSALVFLRVSQGSAVVTLETQNDTNQLINHLHTVLMPGHKKLSKQSVFNLRTEEASAKQYFQFYGYLSQQQNMMQDYVRTATYQSAMLQNSADFKDKVVLDIGAGSGILSFFAVQAGARKVYAIEASSMAVHCQELIKSNRLSDRVTVIAGKLEEVDIPEKIDVIISEPMGYMLFNERMLESFLHAKKWLRPGGKMYPTQGILFCAPFTDDALYTEQLSKANFWYQQSFHGVDLSSLRGAAMDEYLRQPILDTFDVRILMAKPLGHTTDFTKAEETDLHKIVVPLSFKLWSTGTIHGLAVWFDVAFIGSQSTVWLSTAPFQPLTHWYQIRCLLRNPIFARSGQQISGILQLTANERQSYDIDLDVSISGTNIRSKNSYDLKNPNFRYMTAPSSPPGSYHSCPSEAYWDSPGQQQQPSSTPNPVNQPQPVQMNHQPQIITSGYQTSHQPVAMVAGLSPSDQQAAAIPVSMVNGGILSSKLYTPTGHAHGHTFVPQSHMHGYVHHQTHPTSAGHAVINMGPGSPPGSQFIFAVSGGGGVAGGGGALSPRSHDHHVMAGGGGALSPRPHDPHVMYQQPQQTHVHQKLTQQSAALQNHSQP